MDVNFPEFYKAGMESPLQQNVRKLLDQRGLNAYRAAKEAGLGDSFVRDILRGKTRSPSAEHLGKLANVLKTTVEDLQAGAPRPAPPEPATVDVTGLEVVSEVNAGTWREVTILDEPHEPEIIPATRDPRFPRARQYALRVRGDSMDEEFADGSYVTCVDFWDSGVHLRDGLFVHVERMKAGGQIVEITIKAVETIDGKVYLSPRSKNPKWKPILIDGDEDTEVKVRGLVTGGWKPTPI
jgi:SOS-response transcriptional repressor LexA